MKGLGRLPISLPIKEGLKWEGKIKVESATDGGYIVQFDAKDTNPKSQAPFIYDRTVLTREQIVQWTGHELA